MSNTRTENVNKAIGYVAGIENDSIVDGPGIRITVFLQGCPHHCDECQNQETWDFIEDSGHECSSDEIVDILKGNPLVSGLSFSGGEPFCQSEFCLDCITKAKSVRPGISIWIWSGWTFEELISKDDENVNNLLHSCDVLIDGKYLKSERTLSLPWRGSKNQRVIDLTKTFSQHKLVLVPDGN